ncbi:hypothetical protein GGF44_003624, partial [Coemansia sp. RSA 1694]
RLLSQKDVGCDSDGHCSYKHHGWIHIIWSSILIAFFLCVVVWSVFDRCRRHRLSGRSRRSGDIENRHSEPLPKYSPQREDGLPVYSEELSPSDTLRGISCESSVSTPERVVYRDAIGSAHRDIGIASGLQIQQRN